MDRFEEKCIEGLSSLTVKVEGLIQDVHEIREYQQLQNGRVFALADEVTEMKARQNTMATIAAWVRPGVYTLITFLILLALEHPDIVKQIVSK